MKQPAQTFTHSLTLITSTLVHSLVSFTQTSRWGTVNGKTERRQLEKKEPCTAPVPSMSSSCPWLPSSVLDRKGAKSTKISLRSGATFSRARSSLVVILWRKKREKDEENRSEDKISNIQVRIEEEHMRKNSGTYSEREKGQTCKKASTGQITQNERREKGKLSDKKEKNKNVWNAHRRHKVSTIRE